MRIGVLGFQGDVVEHVRMIGACCADAMEIRTPAALDATDALIIPGGESPTIGKLLTRSGLDKAIRARAASGMPVFGTCAGMILMAREAIGGEPPLLALMDMAVSRNAYGRQRESFEAEITSLAIAATPFRVAFIRAPVVMRVGPAVEVMARYNGHPVLLRQGPLLAASFHPEIAGFDGVHRYFCRLVQEALVTA